MFVKLLLVVQMKSGALGGSFSKMVLVRVANSG